MATSPLHAQVAPTISSQPQSRTGAVGTTATFSVTATGTAPLAYQWRKAGTNLADGGRLSGVGTASLTNSSVQVADAGNYTVVVTNAYGSVTSSVATLTVTQLVKQWERDFGGSGDDLLTTLQATPDGGAILGGYSYSGMTGNKGVTNYGGADYWVIKVDATGEKQWERSFGGTADDFLTAVVCTDDGGYALVGYSSSDISGNKTTASFGGNDIWLVKLDAAGNRIWEREYGGSDKDEVQGYSCMIQTSDGGFLLGAYSSVLQESSGSFWG